MGYCPMVMGKEQRGWACLDTGELDLFSTMHGRTQARQRTAHQEVTLRYRFRMNRMNFKLWF